MKINVLYLIDSLEYGGAEKQLIELIENIDKTQHNLHLCCLKPSGSLYDDIDIPKFTLNFKGFSNLNILVIANGLASYIKDNNIQIVQTFFQDPFLLAALSKFFCRTKLIGTFLDLGFWRSPFESFKMRFSYRFFSGFIANSEAVKKHFVDTDHLNHEKVKVIYNGFDFSKVENLSGEKDKAPGYCIGIVANLNRKVKRVDDFIRAAALVKKKCPESYFIIAGDGHLKSELHALAKQLGIGQAVRFLGRIANPLDFVKQMDVGVICSESEGFSNSIIEYMACAVPVVVTDVGGNPELVHDGENGFLVPVGVPEQLADKICKILVDPSMSQQMGEKNRHAIREKFSIAGMAENHARYYRKVLADKK